MRVSIWRGIFLHEKDNCLEICSLKPTVFARIIFTTFLPWLASICAVFLVWRSKDWVSSNRHHHEPWRWLVPVWSEELELQPWKKHASPQFSTGSNLSAPSTHGLEASLLQFSALPERKSYAEEVLHSQLAKLLLWWPLGPASSALRPASKLSDCLAPYWSSQGGFSGPGRDFGLLPLSFTSLATASDWFFAKSPSICCLVRQTFMADRFAS